jgi:hypothetical protein
MPTPNTNSRLDIITSYLDKKYAHRPFSFHNIGGGGSTDTCFMYIDFFKMIEPINQTSGSSPILGVYVNATTNIGIGARDILNSILRKALIKLLSNVKYMNISENAIHIDITYYELDLFKKMVTMIRKEPLEENEKKSDKQNTDEKINQLVSKYFLGKKYISSDGLRKYTTIINKVEKSKRGLFKFTFVTSPHFSSTAQWRTCDTVNSELMSYFHIDNFEFDWKTPDEAVGLTEFK